MKKKEQILLGNNKGITLKIKSTSCSFNYLPLSMIKMGTLKQT